MGNLILRYALGLCTGPVNEFHFHSSTNTHIRVSLEAGTAGTKALRKKITCYFVLVTYSDYTSNRYFDHIANRYFDHIANTYFDHIANGYYDHIPKRYFDHIANRYLTISLTDISTTSLTDI
jgi:hypothetical protein